MSESTNMGNFKVKELKVGSKGMRWSTNSKVITSYKPIKEVKNS